MHYTLIKADDCRDGRTFLWLLRSQEPDGYPDGVTLLSPALSPARIKQRTAANPDGFIWSPGYHWHQYADKNHTIIDRWEFKHQ